MSLLRSDTILRAPRDLSRSPSALLHQLALDALARNDVDEAARCAELLLARGDGVPAQILAARVALGCHRLPEALDLLDRAIAGDPSLATAHVERALVLIRLRRFDQAAEAARDARRLAPEDAAAANTLGIALARLEDYDAAIEQFAQAIRLLPNYPAARWNMGIARLTLGDFARGWDDFEARRDTSTWAPRHFAGPELRTLADARGRRILCYAEQGLGDTLQFVRYATLLADHAAEVIVEVQDTLVGVLADSPGVRVVAKGSTLPSYDAHIPVMSLPRLFRTRIDTVPWRGPYIGVSEASSRAWAQRIGAHGVRIGLAWSGNPAFPDNDIRSFPLAAVRPLTRVAGVRLIALQKGHALKQIAELSPEIPVETLGVDPTMEDTAAVMQHCHLVISCCTAPAHLAGALGRPTWIALHRPGDWRWMLDRTDTPWYPTARLFRQPRPGDWASVFDAMAAALPGLMRPPSH